MPEDTTKQKVEEKLEEIEAMFVQTAPEAAVEGDALTLHDVSRSTLYFSDLPERVVGHVTSEMFVDLWDERENSFAGEGPQTLPESGDARTEARRIGGSPCVCGSTERLSVFGGLPARV